MKKTIYSSFCGTGKTYLCNNFPKEYAELCCWEYQGETFPDNYISDIVDKLNTIKYLFISTNPVALKKLNELGFNIVLIYPKNELKEEYFRRFTNRIKGDPINIHLDFLETMDTYWDGWLNELKEQNYCTHIILKSGEYLQNVLNDGTRN